MIVHNQWTQHTDVVMLGLCSCLRHDFTLALLVSRQGALVREGLCLQKVCMLALCAMTAWV